ncbi:YadA family autotransporter adhesin [Parasutterella muris]|uniref:YadA family autotransporter adhesin n=1 Tax=Parasutterella muris TaxID=2565572 RepID=UPI00203F2B55|nr:YadA-like family protein [Parasutterella muris]
MNKFKHTVFALACSAALSGHAYAGVPADSTGTGWASVAIGQGATADGSGAISIGYGTSGEIGGVAIGNDADAIGDYAAAVGMKAKAEATGSLALGHTSTATRAAGTFGTATEAVSFGSVEKTGTTWVSTSGVVSIGSDTMSRQLTGVAAGSQDNDAVNVAQLKSLQQSSVFGQGSSIEIPASEDGSTPAVNAVSASVLGDSGKVMADAGSAFGANSQVQIGAKGAVAIGANSIATSRLDANGAAPTGYLMPSTGVTNQSVWQADANHGVVSFGGSYEADDGTGNTQTVTFNRQLTGVAAGSEDNDAVNVAQLKEVNTKVDGLMTGDTKVSQIDLLADPGDPENGVPAKGIGLRFEAANTSARAASQSEGDNIGRLAYTDTDGTSRQVATMSDGIFLSSGPTSGGAAVDSVKVGLDQGISFLGEENGYITTTVTAGENGGAVVTIGTTQALKDFLSNSGVQPDTPSGGNNGGSTGGTWTPTAAQQAALNGNFANGITVAAGEGNQAITIQQNNVNMGGNRIQNVGAPIAATDAANKQYVDSTANSLRSKIHDVDRDLRAGVAMAMAVGNLPQAYMPGKSILAMSAGTYHGQGGFALGLSHATNDRNWVFKGAASVDTRGNFGGTLSAGYQF